MGTRRQTSLVLLLHYCVEVVYTSIIEMIDAFVCFLPLKIFFSFIHIFSLFNFFWSTDLDFDMLLLFRYLSFQVV